MSSTTVPRVLKRRALGVGVAYALAIAVAYMGLALAWETESWAGIEWVSLAGGVAAVEWGLCWWYLERNRHPENGQLFTTLGPGNALTLVRGGCIAIAAGFLAIPYPQGALAWVPAGLCVLAGLADYADGVLARYSDHETELGAALDVEFDGFGTVVAAALCVRYDQVFVAYLAVGLARYAFVCARAHRRRRGRRTLDLPESARRRYLYVAQFTTSSLALTPVVGPGPVLDALAAVVGGAFLCGFAYDWLLVSGRLDP